MIQSVSLLVKVFVRAFFEWSVEWFVLISREYILWIISVSTWEPFLVLVEFPFALKFIVSIFRSTFTFASVFASVFISIFAFVLTSVFASAVISIPFFFIISIIVFRLTFILSSVFGSFLNIMWGLIDGWFIVSLLIFFIFTLAVISYLFFLPIFVLIIIFVFVIALISRLIFMIFAFLITFFIIVSTSASLVSLVRLFLVTPTGFFRAVSLFFIQFYSLQFLFLL